MDKTYRSPLNQDSWVTPEYYIDVAFAVPSVGLELVHGFRVIESCESFGLIVGIKAINLYERLHHVSLCKLLLETPPDNLEQNEDLVAVIFPDKKAQGIICLSINFKIHINFI